MTAMDEAATLQAYRISLVFLFCKIRTRDILRKEYVVWLQIYSAAIVPNIIKMVNI